MNTNKAAQIVYIVHHIDTEGPLSEPIVESFKRLENVLNIKLDLKPSRENLARLQNGEAEIADINLKKEISKIARLINFKSSWFEVDEMLCRILKENYRKKFVDSFGGNWLYNWHIMDHVGFETNERSRDLGYLNIFNHYEYLLNLTDSHDDEMHWHFHPIPFFKEAHIAATSFENSYYELHQIISRRLIEKLWFPKINRPGFHAVRPDSNWFLEQWIPYCASNQSVEETPSLQTDNMFGRFGDWNGAVDDWSIYHPDLYDWRKKGNLKRFISRVLNMNTRFRNITEKEIEKAFLKAQKEHTNVYLGITNHDFREMSSEIEEFYTMLQTVSSKFPDIPYKFSGALEAFREVIGFDKDEIKNNKIDFEAYFKENVLILDIKNGDPFGPQPYLAIKTVTGQYFHDNFDFGEFKKQYYYTFDRYTINLNIIDTISIASNDIYGNTCMIRIGVKDGKILKSEKKWDG